VPGEIEFVQLRRGHLGRIDAECRQDREQVLPMQDVQPYEGAPAAAHRFHGGVIALAPGIGERARIDERLGVAREEWQGIARNTAPPIDDGAEYIEDQSADAIQYHRV
jgi:hypothetical protein